MIDLIENKMDNSELPEWMKCPILLLIVFIILHFKLNSNAGGQ